MGANGVVAHILSNVANRTNYRTRASELGLAMEFDSLQRLRGQSGLNDPVRLLELNPRLIRALGVSTDAGAEELNEAVSQFAKIAEGFPPEDRLLAQLTWNLPVTEKSILGDKKLPREAWMERSEAAASGQYFRWNDGAAIRHHSNRIIFATLIELAGRFDGNSGSTSGVTTGSSEPTLQSLSASLTVSTSPSEYKTLILTLEREAQRISRLPKRISTIFKSDSAVVELAMKRFGEGSSNIEHYVEEHLERKKMLFASLEEGLVLREIYSLEELTSYYQKGIHGFHIRMSDDSISQTFANWINAIEQFDHYHVALTSEPLPLKYEVINDIFVVMHEVVGQADAHRVNAISIESMQVAQKFQSDFDLIWERTAKDFRDKNFVLDTIKELISEKRKV